MKSHRRQRLVRAALAGRHRHRVARIRPGVPPGTLVTAEAAERPALETITFSADGVERRRADTIDAALDRQASGAVTWLNIDGVGDASVFARLGERLGLHPLTLEDVVNVPQRPKVERFEKYLFVILRTMRLERPPDATATDVDPRTAIIRSEQVSLFLGADWVVTIQERADGDSFGPVREAIEQGRGRVREAGADYLAYLLVDAVVDAYFPVLDALAERMHALEEEALAPSVGLDEGLLALTRLRHDLVAVRRAVWPLREEVAVLQREETALISPESRVFFRDVYDHTIQALEIVESLRETAVSVMEVFLSSQNQRLNEVMKVLTVIATVFIPLTFIASIYGMNFKHMPELEWGYGYPLVLGAMGLVALGMIGYFKKRGWW
jgi:magnesium transporter